MDFNPDVFTECLDSDLNRCISTSDVTHFRIHALKNAVLKKYVAKGANSELHNAAMTDFVALNSRILDFRLDSNFANGSVFRTWKALLFDVFHSGSLQTCSLNLSRCIDLGKCGPGASLSVESTSFLEKMFYSPLTTTDISLLSYYRQTVSGTRWWHAEEIRAKLFRTETVLGSSLTSVPKDRTKNRTICIEPALNMFYQLGAKAQIESVLKQRCRIDLSTQADVNKDLAKRGSITGDLVTLDLKNASDSISIELVRALLPPDVLGVLMKIRSPATYVTIGGRKELVELGMLSTMGNGFTFPLMTLLFTTLIKAVSIHANARCENGEDFGVFGDDLIIRSELADTLVSCLNHAGFEVNTSKSFFAGPFRESCGGDYYRGHDVRGIYLKEMDNDSQAYSAFNRLHFWSMRSGVDLNRTLTYLLGLAKFQPVPGHAGVHEGHIVTHGQLTSPKRDRNGAIFYRSLSSEPTKSLRVRRFETNYHGCLTAFVGGYVSDKSVSCRNRMKWTVVKKKTPSWDHLTHPGVTRRALDLSWSVLLSTD